MHAGFQAAGHFRISLLHDDLHRAFALWSPPVPERRAPAVRFFRRRRLLRGAHSRFHRRDRIFRERGGPAQGGGSPKKGCRRGDPREKTETLNPCSIPPPLTCINGIDPGKRHRHGNPYGVAFGAASLMLIRGIWYFGEMRDRLPPHGEGGGAARARSSLCHTS